MRDKASVARVVVAAWSRLGGIDMLVNTAGIGMRTVNPRFMTHPQNFWDVPADDFRLEFRRLGPSGRHPPANADSPG